MFFAFSVALVSELQKFAGDGSHPSQRCEEFCLETGAIIRGNGNESFGESRSVFTRTYAAYADYRQYNLLKAMICFHFCTLRSSE